MTTSYGHRQPSELPCKYFLAGKCANGTACPFAHVSPDARPTCRFFLAGNCKHGSKCVLLHVYPTDSFLEDPEYPTFSDARDGQEDEEALLRDLLMLTVSDESDEEDALDFGAVASAILRASQATHESIVVCRRRQAAHAEIPVATTVSRGNNELVHYGTASFSAAAHPAALSPSFTATTPTTDQAGEGALNKKKDLCAFAVIGKCKFGSSCRNLHGLQCPRCLRFCLHPTELEQNEGAAISGLFHLDHLNTCMHKPSRETPEASEDIECGICLDKVLSKADPRFGILSSVFTN